MGCFPPRFKTGEAEAEVVPDVVEGVEEAGGLLVDIVRLVVNNHTFRQPRNN